jgi:hypothetical protein
MAVELCPTKISDLEQKIKYFDRVRLLTKLEIMRMRSQPGYGTEADLAATEESLAEVEEELRQLVRRHESATSLLDSRD